jgi:hypothetical protein
VASFLSPYHYRKVLKSKMKIPHMVRFKNWLRKEQSGFVASVVIVANIQAWVTFYMLSAYGLASALAFSLVFVGPAIGFALVHRELSKTPEERERARHREDDWGMPTQNWF